MFWKKISAEEKIVALMKYLNGQVTQRQLPEHSVLTLQLLITGFCITNF